VKLNLDHNQHIYLIYFIKINEIDIFIISIFDDDDDDENYINKNTIPKKHTYVY
jgi:hypothetical protein